MPRLPDQVALAFTFPDARSGGASACPPWYAARKNPLGSGRPQFPRFARRSKMHNSESFPPAFALSE
jgi:hypothetical protein